MGKPEVTRKNLILASIKLAKENGPSNVTVREICDEAGILGVYSIGANLDRSAAGESAVTIRFEKTENKGE